ncbi:hypothetical protein HanRHA438_Chr08g0362571 [Helianthus annuus]|nr:hypothetical protein HanIR_Chr08g0378031 [Helianthus annuus]KAJ0898942.1 hypothetical protein HanRHA438_Chr08g0362571 [Helianthus annuus]
MTGHDNLLGAEIEALVPTMCQRISKKDTRIEPLVKFVYRGGWYYRGSSGTQRPVNDHTRVCGGREAQ